MFAEHDNLINRVYLLAEAQVGSPAFFFLSEGKWLLILFSAEYLKRFRIVFFLGS